MSAKGKSKKKQQQQKKEEEPKDNYPFIKQNGKNVTMEIEVKPNAKESEIQRIEDGVLKVSIDSPPVDGKANIEVVAFMAKTFGIKKSYVSVIKGQTAHHKTILFENWTREQIIAVINSK